MLGPERMSRFPPVEEFDFYNAKYRDTDGALLPIEIEATLIDLSEEVSNRCANHTRYWHRTERRLLGPGEAKKVDDPPVCACLRLKTIAQYDPEDDTFVGRTVFVDGPDRDGAPVDVLRSVKRLFGFLYLRALRTGSRALSLERGSLLDVILQQRGVRTGIWEDAITR